MDRILFNRLLSEVVLNMVEVVDEGPKFNRGHEFTPDLASALRKCRERSVEVRRRFYFINLRPLIQLWLKETNPAEVGMAEEEIHQDWTDALYAQAELFGNALHYILFDEKMEFVPSVEVDGVSVSLLH